MAVLTYGTHKAFIGVDEHLTHCPCCEVDTFQEILVTSNYYHIYLIPVFPIGKEVTFVCEKCGLRRTDVPLTPATVKDYTGLNKKFKHPWHTYLCTLFIGALALIAVLIELSAKK